MKPVVVVGAVAGIVRAAAFCVGAFLVSETADWRQVLGYALGLLGLPETLVTRELRGEPILWAITSSVVVVGGTIVWVTGFVWLTGWPRRISRGV